MVFCYSSPNRLRYLQRYNQYSLFLWSKQRPYPSKMLNKYLGMGKKIIWEGACFKVKIPKPCSLNILGIYMLIKPYFSF